MRLPSAFDFRIGKTARAGEPRQGVRSHLPEVSGRGKVVRRAPPDDDIATAVQRNSKPPASRPRRGAHQFLHRSDARKRLAERSPGAIAAISSSPPSARFCRRSASSSAAWWRASTLQNSHPTASMSTLQSAGAAGARGWRRRAACSFRESSGGTLFRTQRARAPTRNACCRARVRERRQRRDSRKLARTRLRAHVRHGRDECSDIAVDDQRPLRFEVLTTSASIARRYQS
jgi:hypothetical protein